VKILFVQRFDIENVSCARRAVCLASQLSARGHHVTLVNFPHAERRRTLPSVEPDLHPSVRTLELDRRSQAFFRNRRILVQEARKAEIVHLWKSYPDVSLPVLGAGLSTRTPIHYDWDDWETEITRELTGSNLAAHLVGMMERETLRFARTLSTASRELRRIAVQWGFPEGRIWDAPVGADLERFHPGNREHARTLAERLWPGQAWPDPEHPVIVYLGQLEVANFALQALEVFARLEHRRARMLVVGGGSGLAGLKARAEGLGLGNRVTFTDYVPSEEVPLYLALADVMLSPFEDTPVARCKSPLKIAEALAAGLPVVAGDVGEAPIMLQGCGRLCPPGHVEEMTAATESLLHQPDTRAAMSRAARQRAETAYNWSAIAGNLEEAYRTAVDLKR
jgi:glycosyltransferase involved in cell wall biosynthesis